MTAPRECPCCGLLPGEECETDRMIAEYISRMRGPVVSQRDGAWQVETAGTSPAGPGHPGGAS